MLHFQRPSLPNIKKHLIFLFAIGAWPISAFAHVKWFSEASFADRPLTLQEAITPTFLALALLSMLVIGAFVYLDMYFKESPWYQQISSWLEQRRDKGTLVMRLTVGVVMLLCWQSNAMLVPDLAIEGAGWISWFQLLIAFLLLFDRTVILAGSGLLLLYGIGLIQFGAFYMLDYLFFIGVGAYLVFHQTQQSHLRKARLFVLYSTIGFSLCWVGLEKIIYPQWGLSILEEHSILTLGLSPSFFLLAAAFIEFSLGFLIMIRVMERPLALIITLVFFLTTMVFGKVEVVGHLLLHGTLIVFLLEGPGNHRKVIPAMFKKYGRPSRAVFAPVQCAVLFTLLIVPYTSWAWFKYETSAQADPHTHEQLDVGDSPDAPSMELVLHKDPASGWNLEIVTDHFRFTPEDSGHNAVIGEGHAHLFINGKKTARLYGPWYHLPEFEPGSYNIQVTLNANNHAVFAQNQEPIAAYLQLDIGQDSYTTNFTLASIPIN